MPIYELPLGRTVCQGCGHPITIPVPPAGPGEEVVVSTQCPRCGGTAELRLTG